MMNPEPDVNKDATTAATATATTSKKKHRPRAAKVEAQNEHYKLVLDAAHAVTEIFNAHHLNCAVFGSLAAKLYGSSRSPKDVDLLVISNSDVDAPQLKDLVLRTNSRNFYLKLPRDPAAEYRIMWYRTHYRGPECKVDILVPGIMYLPHLPPTRIVHQADPVRGPPSTIPVVPFSLLLLHKLQGWDDHRKAEEKHKSKKQHQDAADVRKLLALRHEMAQLAQAPPWGDEELFTQEFQALTVDRVKAYCEAFPDRAKEWQTLGFDIS